jgi:hypothetical protein
MSALSFSIVVVVAANTNSVETNVHLTRALYIAEAGLERKIAQMNNDNNDDMKGEFAGGAYVVDVTDWEADGVDNNSDGTVDDPGEANYFTITSFAVINTRERKIETIVKLVEGEIPGIYGAIQLYNPVDPNTGEPVPGTLANFSGNTPPRVSGLDTDIPDGIDFGDVRASDATIGDGPGGVVLGVTTNDDQSVVDITQEISRNPDRVDGLDVGQYGDDLAGYFDNPPEDPTAAGGCIANTSSFDPLTAIGVQLLADEYKTYATPEYTFTASDYPTGDVTIGTVDDPVVTVIETAPNEQIHLSGCVSGAGILVIDGNVRFGGTFNYAGLVIITSNGTAEVDLRGTPLVFGCIIGASQNPEDINPTVLDIRGTSDVYYSTEGLSKAQDALAGAGGVAMLMLKEVTTKEAYGGGGG